REEQHVALLDFLEAANARPVEPDALSKQVRREVPRRNREMLPEPGQVDELEVDDLDSSVFYEGDSLVYSCLVDGRSRDIGTIDQNPPSLRGAVRPQQQSWMIPSRADPGSRRTPRMPACSFGRTAQFL